jgi:predicted acylesterase/phospholipase RssA
MKRIFLTFAVVASVLLFSCSTVEKGLVVYDKPLRTIAPSAVRDDGDYFVAVAVSGGGSRAAVFSAAVMKELYEQVKLPDGRSIIDEIDYISSVSGGSLAMAYYCMKKPDVGSSHTDLYDPFFAAYLADMQKNIESELTGGFIFEKISTIFRSMVVRGMLIKQTFDLLYFHGQAFDALRERQDKGSCPTLIVNGTVMDTGSKFLFTTLSHDDFGRVPNSLREKLANTGLGKSEYHVGGDLLGIVTCDDIGLSIEDMEISRAVAASAAVPVALGPIILKDRARSKGLDQYFLHVNDGGINDNNGITSVMQLLLGRLDRKPGGYRGGMIIVIDSNQDISPARTEKFLEGFKLTSIAGRALDISFYRGKAFTYATIMFLMSSDPRFKDFTFVYITPYSADDETIKRLFDETPTRFRIEGDKADNLELAARIVVGEAKETILKSYGSYGEAKRRH